MENPLFFIQRYSSLKEAIIKEYKNESTINLIAFLAMFVIFPGFYGIGEIIRFFPKDISNLLALFMALLVLIAIFVSIYTVLYYLIQILIIIPYSRYFDVVISTIIDSHKLIGSKIKDQQTINQILDKLQKILTLSRIIIRLDKKIHSSQKLTKDYGSLVSESIEWIIRILLDLRSDLSIRLTEQQKTLESAKIEVEKNIQGTTELEQVSEVQKIRLDRQIEQFEELQRVLVKI